MSWEREKRRKGGKSRRGERLQSGLGESGERERESSIELRLYQ